MNLGRISGLVLLVTSSSVFADAVTPLNPQAVKSTIMDVLKIDQKNIDEDLAIEKYSDSLQNNKSLSAQKKDQLMTQFIDQQMKKDPDAVKLEQCMRNSIPKSAFAPQEPNDQEQAFVGASRDAVTAVIKEIATHDASAVQRIVQAQADKTREELFTVVKGLTIERLRDIAKKNQKAVAIVMKCQAGQRTQLAYTRLIWELQAKIAGLESGPTMASTDPKTAVN